MSNLILIKETVVDNCALFGFEYNGKSGNVDPYWENGTDNFLLYFDGHEQVVNTFDEVLHTPFVCGNCLIDIHQTIIATEY